MYVYLLEQGVALLLLLQPQLQQRDVLLLVPLLLVHLGARRRGFHGGRRRGVFHLQYVRDRWQIWCGRGASDGGGRSLKKAEKMGSGRPPAAA